MSLNKENINNALNPSEAEKSERRTKNLNYERVYETIKVNLEPLNDLISNLKKLLQQLVSKLPHQRVLVQIRPLLQCCPL